MMSARGYALHSVRPQLYFILRVFTLRGRVTNTRFTAGTWSILTTDWTTTVTDQSALSGRMAVTVHVQIGDMTLTLSQPVNITTPGKCCEKFYFHLFTTLVRVQVFHREVPDHQGGATYNNQT